MPKSIQLPVHNLDSPQEIRLRYPHGCLKIWLKPLQLQFIPDQDWGWFFVFLIALLLTGLISGTMLPAQTRLYCSHSQGNCHLKEQSFHLAPVLLGRAKKTQVISIKSVHKVTIFREQRWRSVSYFLALHPQERLQQKPLLLLGSAQNDLRENWKQQLETFMADTSRPDLELIQLEIGGILLFDLPIYGFLLFLLWRSYKRLQGEAPNAWRLKLNADTHALQGIRYSEFWGQLKTLDLSIEGASFCLREFSGHARLGLFWVDQAHFEFGDCFFNSIETLSELKALQLRLNAELEKIQHLDQY